VKYLKAFPKGQKSLVFSQFCKFLDAIEPHLVREGINVVRFDGSMSAKARAKVLSEFQKPVTAKPGKKAGDIFTAGDGKRRAKKEVIEVDDSATEVSSDEEVVERKPVKRFSRKAKGKGRALVESDHDYEDSDAGEQDEEDARSSTRPTVMLISLKSGSVGINLTAAQVCSRIAWLAVWNESRMKLMTCARTSSSWIRGGVQLLRCKLSTGSTAS
jgi:SWI/SNF-related matrix-associated actin-dependent regulator of chromatin subfamily A3